MPLGIIALFVLPALLLFGIFLLYPLLAALSYSLFEWKGTSRGDFIGFANFVTLATDLPYREAIPRAFLHNALFFAGMILLQNTVGLFFAYQLHKRPRIRRFFQTLYAMPYLVSPLVIGYLWTLLLSPSFGPINALLKRIGLESLALPWLGDPNLALGIVILIAVWQWIGFPVLLYGAALGGLPEETTQAASIDGASNWQAFRYVTLPLLLPAVGTVSVLTFIFSMEVFPLVYAIGGSTGSPAGATDVMALLFYRVSFQSGTPNALGVSSAVAAVLFLVIFGTAMIATRALRSAERRLS
ncbi:MAG: sugar ABC transporter permease [Microbacterium sp.]